MSTRAYDSLATFYAEPTRWRSSERDVGLRWRADGGPVYRAAWVCDTGELYSVRLVTDADEAGTVEVLGRVETRAELERALTGWQDVCGIPGSYGWLRARAAAMVTARRRDARESSRSYLPGGRLSRPGLRAPRALARSS
jgi:hypothetical protein